MALLSDSSAGHLPTVQALLDQGHGAVERPGERLEGRGLFGWLAARAPLLAWSGLRGQPHRTVGGWANGVAWEQPRPAEAVFLRLLKGGVNPWEPLSVSREGPSIDGFDLACAWGSVPLARACLAHPDRPPFAVLHVRRPAWRLSGPDESGISKEWGRFRSPEDSLLTAACLDDSPGLVRLLVANGWPLAPTRGLNPWAAVRSMEAFQALALALSGAAPAVEASVLETWQAIAAVDPVARRSLPARLARVSSGRSVLPTQAKAAVDAWLKRDLAELRALHDAFLDPATEGGLEGADRRARAWARMPPLHLQSAGFSNAGPVPVWLHLGYRAMVASQTGVLPMDACSTLARLAEQRVPDVAVRGHVISVRGAALLAGGRASTKRGSEERDALARLGWNEPGADTAGRLLEDASKALDVWTRLGTASHGKESTVAFSRWFDQWSARPALPLPADPCWAAFRQAVTPGAFSKSFEKVFTRVFTDASWSVEEACGWVPFLAQAREWEALGVLSDGLRKQAPGWTEADLEALGQSLAEALGASADERAEPLLAPLAAVVASARLDAAWPATPDRPRGLRL